MLKSGLNHTSHISNAQQRLIASGYHIGQHRTFLSLQSILLNLAV